MKDVYINLPSINAVQKFVMSISQLDGNFDLIDGKYILDARSLLGILSMDLTMPVKLSVEKDTPDTMRAIEPFVADQIKAYSSDKLGKGAGLPG